MIGTVLAIFPETRVMTVAIRVKLIPLTNNIADVHACTCAHRHENCLREGKTEVLQH